MALNRMMPTIPTVITSREIERYLESELWPGTVAAKIMLVFPNLQWLDYSFRETLAGLGNKARPIISKQTIETNRQQIVFVTVDRVPHYRGTTCSLVAFVVDDAFAEAWQVAHLIGMSTV